MRFLIDECVSDEIGRLLRQAGHDVVFVRNVAPAAKDGDILPLGISLERIIVTHDYDYGDLIFRDGVPSIGVVILAPGSDTAASAQEIAEQAEILTGSLTTIGQRRTRRRIIQER
jgi:predicted nuclease of predicted toxin-antitoxin system